MTPSQANRLDDLERRFGSGNGRGGNRVVDLAGNRVPTANSFRPPTGCSDTSSIPSCAVRSSVISLELEIERERRVKAEQELAQLKEQLAQKEKEAAIKQTLPT